MCAVSAGDEDVAGGSDMPPSRRDVNALLGGFFEPFHGTRGTASRAQRATQSRCCVLFVQTRDTRGARDAKSGHPVAVSGASPASRDTHDTNARHYATRTMRFTRMHHEPFTNFVIPGDAS
jgi:hypothetical protein